MKESNYRLKTDIRKYSSKLLVVENLYAIEVILNQHTARK